MIARLELASTRQVLASNIHVATSFRQRLVGLMGRAGLEPEEAMLFERARQVHTFGMRFPIDVVFCDREWRVVHVVHGLRPLRATRVVRGAHRVLELSEGAAAGVAEGDLLVPS
jgi:uncharacterized membrane protein (UPF0127 family)